MSTTQTKTEFLETHFDGATDEDGIRNVVLNTRSPWCDSAIEDWDTTIDTLAVDRDEDGEWGVTVAVTFTGTTTDVSCEEATYSTTGRYTAIDDLTGALAIAHDQGISNLQENRERYRDEVEQDMIDQAPTYTGVLTDEDCTSYIWWKPAVELEGYLTRDQPEETYDIYDYEYVGPEDVDEAFRLDGDGRVRSRGHESMGCGARAITTRFYEVGDLDDLTPGGFYELTVSARYVVEALESAVAEIGTGLPEGIDIGVTDTEYADGVGTCDLFVSNADTEVEIVTEVTITPQDIDDIDEIDGDCAEDGIHWEITTSGDIDFLIEEALGSIPGMLTKALPEAVADILGELGDAA